MPADQPLTTDNPIALSERTNSESQPFVGQWNELVSTTNWDKGAIICQWRASLESAGVASAEYSDEAWSQLVGGVTPQHVGRLRRTAQRFGEVYRDYAGIYWSHFYAALEWDDAEMWLEGAVQNRWSVSAMRKQRWETLGQVGQSPDGEPVVTSELAEETQSLALSERPRNNDRDYVQGPVHEGPDWGDADTPASSTALQQGAASEDVPFDEPSPASTTPPVRPFESFDQLPDDVQDAATAFKIAIIRHKSEDWEEISQQDMLGLLDALKQLATLARE